MRIAFFGTGIMGAPMVRNLLANGHPVAVYNRNRDKAEPLAAEGASVVGDPAEAVRANGGAEALICMLTGPEAVDAVLFGEQGAAAELKPGMIVVNMSTVTPAYNRELAARVAELGARFVEAPVAGSKQPAEDGTLVILAGGAAEDVAALMPAFTALGRKTLHCGAVSTATTAKLAGNMLLGTMIAGLGETLAFGEAGGLDRRMLLKVILAGPMGCALFQMKEEMLASGQFPAQFPARHMAKDLGFASITAEELGARRACLETALGLYREAIERGFGDEDFSAVSKVFGA